MITKSKKKSNKLASGGDIAKGVVGGVSSLLGTAGPGLFNNRVEDSNKSIRNAVEAVDNYVPDTSSVDSVLSSNTMNFNAPDDNYRSYMRSYGERFLDFNKSTLSGASAGSVAGPWGALAGGIAGSLLSSADIIKEYSDAKRFAEDMVNTYNIGVITNSSKANNALEALKNMNTRNFNLNRAYGGPLYKHSGDWSNGITFINEGGTHELNPIGGVLMGFDNEGTPNLVEEGEVIYNDYVFSNRLKPTKKQLNNLGLNKKYNDWTFARIVEDLQKNSAETPNDKISMDSLNDMMNIMTSLQEEIRTKKGLKGQNRLMANGGNIFDGKRDIRVNNLLDRAEAAEKEGNIKKRDRLLNRAINVEEGDILDFSNIGMYAPLVESAFKTAYNTLNPIDNSNIIAEESYSAIPKVDLLRLGHNKIVYRPTDKNALTSPIINTSRAAIADVQNNSQTNAQALANIANITANTQESLGKAYLQADLQDITNALKYAQFNLGIDQADANLSQAEQMANIQRADKIAAARVADATALEQLYALKGSAIDKTSAALAQEAADLTKQGIEWDWVKSHPDYADYVKWKESQKKCGGMLTKRRK